VTDKHWEEGFGDDLPLGQCEDNGPHDCHVVIEVTSYHCQGEALPKGLCANKNDHAPHPVYEGALAPFWCTAEQEDREPYRSEQRRNNVHGTQGG
jgi:hypothetical protein